MQLVISMVVCQYECLCGVWCVCGAMELHLVSPSSSRQFKHATQIYSMKSHGSYGYVVRRCDGMKKFRAVKIILSIINPEIGAKKVLLNPADGICRQLWCFGCL